MRLTYLDLGRNTTVREIDEVGEDPAIYLPVEPVRSEDVKMLR
jgi:hypothetical protein